MIMFTHTFYTARQDDNIQSLNDTRTNGKQNENLRSRECNNLKTPSRMKTRLWINYNVSAQRPTRKRAVHTSRTNWNIIRTTIYAKIPSRILSTSLRLAYTVYSSRNMKFVTAACPGGKNRGKPPPPPGRQIRQIVS